MKNKFRFFAIIRNEYQNIFEKKAIYGKLKVYVVAIWWFN